MRPTMAVFTLLAVAAQAQPVKRSELASILNFEAGANGSQPKGWGGAPESTLFADDKIVHSGKWAARLERDASSPNTFSTITLGIPIDFSGSRLELRGFLKTEDVTEFFGFWMREDGDAPTLQFNSMQSQHLSGTRDWSEYSISLPLVPEAKRLYFGVLIAGAGRVWADDLQLLVDGKPIWDAPGRIIVPTSLDRDHEFDNGSRIALTAFTRVQIDNLATLGKVWGFLKYHHPAIVSGDRHWDYDLFRFLPKVLAALDHAAANEQMHQWIASLGELKECSRCASLNPAGLALKPDLEWINNQQLLGANLSRDLQNILKNRPADGKQFYVSATPGAGNPSFDHEPRYATIKLPDPGFQLLALYRFWNIVEYWYPNRDIVGENWDDVLAEFIPRIALARTADAYQLELMALIAKVHDTHANLWSSLQVRPPVGDCQLPIVVRFIEDRAVVSGFAQTDAAAASGLKIGDVIVDLDGTPVSTLREQWAPYYADSNDPTQLRDIARSMTRGACASAALRIARGDETLTISTSRVRPAALNLQAGATHDLPGDAFRKLSDDVAYVKISTLKTADVPRGIDSAKGTKGLIIDIRNYPSDFPIFALGGSLVDKATPFATFTVIDLSNPGAFHFGATPELTRLQPHYGGKVVVLVDEITLSSAEYHAMAFRAAGGIVIGSTTAGADGNVSGIPLPGGVQTRISGLGVFYPDKEPTQRVGIIPDIEVKPTIAGIRAGRDEVLERALREILGPDVPQARIEALAAPDAVR